MHNSQPNWFLWCIEKVLPWLTLGFLLLSIGAYFFYAPYIGFNFDPKTGHIDLLYIDTPNENSLRVGDMVIQVGDVKMETFIQKPQQILFEKHPIGTTIPIIVERNGKKLEIPWQYLTPSAAEVIERVNNFWWLPLIFWTAGISISFLVRPKDTRWYLLLLFNFLTATWLITGLFSQSHLINGFFVKTFAIWLCVPIYIHLHWVFPFERRKISAFFLWLGYLTAIILALAEYLYWIPRRTSENALLLAIIISLILLIVAFIRHPTQRSIIFPLAFGLGVVFLPLFLVVGMRISGMPLPDIVSGGAMLGLAALPGIYFFTIYRLQYGKLTSQMGRWYILYLTFVGLLAILFIVFAGVIEQISLRTMTIPLGMGVLFLSALIMLVGLIPFISLPALVGAYTNNRGQTDNNLEVRANRLLTPVLFFLFVATAVLGFCIFLLVSFQLPYEAIFWIILTTLITSVLVFIGYQPFRRLMENRIFGITHATAHLLPLYANRITRSYHRDNLSTLLSQDIFPSLSIRQSAVLFFDGNQSLQEICLYGISNTQLPNQADMRALVTNRATPLGFANPLDWIQLALPLNFDNNLIGAWLFGRRDPDDLYSQEDLLILQTLADQTATALMNIVQREKLHELYRHNINRHEQERLRLSRILHDDILNGMTALGLYTDKKAVSQFREIYQSITTQIKQASRGLRPAMLNYGLWSALDELTTNLREQHVNVDILLNVPTNRYRYPPDVELHIFRIVQEALRNIFRHTQAQSVNINGTLTEQTIRLMIIDDGQGFSVNDISLEYLLQHNHFGLAGIYERAEIVGAHLHIKSTPNKGTIVTINWQERGRFQ